MNTKKQVIFTGKNCGYEKNAYLCRVFFMVLDY